MSDLSRDLFLEIGLSWQDGRDDCRGIYMCTTVCKLLGVVLMFLGVCVCVLG